MLNPFPFSGDPIWPEAPTDWFPDFGGGVLRVTYPENFPTLTYRSEETGRMEGSEIQVIDSIGRRFNFDIRYALRAGKGSRIYCVHNVFVI